MGRVITFILPDRAMGIVHCLVLCQTASAEAIIRALKMDLEAVNRVRLLEMGTLAKKLIALFIVTQPLIAAAQLNWLDGVWVLDPVETHKQNDSLPDVLWKSEPFSKTLMTVKDGVMSVVIDSKESTMNYTYSNQGNVTTVFFENGNTGTLQPTTNGFCLIPAISENVDPDTNLVSLCFQPKTAGESRDG